MIVETYPGREGRDRKRQEERGGEGGIGEERKGDWVMGDEKRGKVGGWECENVLMEEYERVTRLRGLETIEGRFSELSWMTVSDLMRPSKQAAWISQSASRKSQSASRKPKRNERLT